MDIRRIGIRELRNDLSSRIDAAHFRGEPTVITRNGEPRAVLISYAAWLASQKNEGSGDPA